MRVAFSARSTPIDRRNARGNAIAEVIGVLLAMTPFFIGIPILGKQFDVKHKALDAARYAAWERTVWRNDGISNRKSEEQIELEVRDRILGHPGAGLITARSMTEVGVSDNPLWRDAHRQPLIANVDGDAEISVDAQTAAAPVDVGYLLVPGLAYGHGSAKAIEAGLGVSDLRLGERTFARARVSIGMRHILAHESGPRDSNDTEPDNEQREPRLAMTADAGILSDAWSVGDENTLRHRVDDLTTDELIESLEFTGQAIALQASGKGKPLYGEGQYAAHPDLRPASNALPAAYVPRK